MSKSDKPPADQANPSQNTASSPLRDVLGNIVDTRPPEDRIGERIKERRTDLKLSVEQLADLTREFDFEEGKGVPRSTLYGYESGSSKPAARELRLLAFALNISPTWLLLSGEWDAAAERNARIAKLFGDLLTELNPAIPVGDNSIRDMLHDEKIRKIKGLQ